MKMLEDAVHAFDDVRRNRIGPSLDMRVRIAVNFRKLQQYASDAIVQPQHLRIRLRICIPPPKVKQPVCRRVFTGLYDALKNL